MKLYTIIYQVPEIDKSVTLRCVNIQAQNIHGAINIFSDDNLINRFEILSIQLLKPTI